MVCFFRGALKPQKKHSPAALTPQKPSHNAQGLVVDADRRFGILWLIEFCGDFMTSLRRFYDLTAEIYAVVYKLTIK
jgi:hypothetical protein